MLRRLVTIALCLTLGGCWPPFPPKPTPTPSPSPTVAPTPEPTPELPPGPVCEEGQHCGCWHRPPDNNWLYACCVPNVPGGVINVAGGPSQCPPLPTPTPTPAPTPTPTPPPSGQCTVRLDGTREMGAYWYSPWGSCTPAARQCIADATPRIINAERCTEVGYPGRIKCPVVPDEHPQRGVCETALMGGPNPVWELQVFSGDLKLNADPWKAHVTGTGTGRLRACYPNGAACSQWLEVNK